MRRCTCPPTCSSSGAWADDGGTGAAADDEWRRAHALAKGRRPGATWPTFAQRHALLQWQGPQGEGSICCRRAAAAVLLLLRAVCVCVCFFNARQERGFDRAKSRPLRKATDTYPPGLFSKPLALSPTHPSSSNNTASSCFLLQIFHNARLQYVSCPVLLACRFFLACRCRRVVSALPSPQSAPADNLPPSLARLRSAPPLEVTPPPKPFAAPAAGGRLRAQRSTRCLWRRARFFCERRPSSHTATAACSTHDSTQPADPNTSRRCFFFPSDKLRFAQNGETRSLVFCAAPGASAGLAAGGGCGCARGTNTPRVGGLLGS